MEIIDPQRLPASESEIDSTQSRLEMSDDHKLLNEIFEDSSYGLQLLDSLLGSDTIDESSAQTRG